MVRWIAEALDVVFPPVDEKGFARQITPEIATTANRIRISEIAIIIRYESAGDPGAVNTWDSNFREGHPSRGLMQVTPDTFSKYATDASKGISDPVQNIVAGMRYILTRYGASWKVPGVIAIREGRPYVGY